MNANNNEIGCNNHSREVNPKSTEESGSHPSTKTRILLDGKEETYLAVEGKEVPTGLDLTCPSYLTIDERQVSSLNR